MHLGLTALSLPSILQIIHVNNMKSFFKIRECLWICLISLCVLSALAEAAKEVAPTQETNAKQESEPPTASSSLHADFENFLWQRDTNEAHKVIFKTVDKPKMAQGYIGKGRMFAARNIEEGETIYVYSLKGRTQVISAQEALADPVFGPAIDKYVARDEKQQKGTFLLYDDQIMKLYLMYLTITKPAQWTPYLDILPKNLDLPVYWTDEEIEELKGSQLYRTTHKLRTTIRRDYEELFPKLSVLLPELFPVDAYTYDLFAWAFNTYGARMWYKSKIVFHPILPLMEVFNYKEESSVKIEEREGSLYLIATEDIEKGEEIFVNDGLVGNRDLLEFYGFVITNNPNDTVSVAVGLDPTDRMFGNKKQLLKQRGLKDGQSYPLSANQIPSDLIFSLRIYHVNVYDYEEAESAFKDDVISSQNEIAVANTLIDMCQKTLKLYPTTNKFDKELLKEKLPRRLYNAVILRRSEKKILYKTLDKAKEILLEIQRKWEYRSMDVPGEALKAYPAEPDQIL